jgi:spore coat polysaccharide biosynthesis protein SpsF
MKPRVVAIIQARMGSSRLPGKVLKDIAGQPMLSRVYTRTSRATTVDQTLVATTIEKADDPIAEYCDFSGIPFSRGSQFDVLDRYYQAALQAEADIVVRVTADCPVIDPVLIDEVVNTLIGEPEAGGERGTEFDFAANRLPPPLQRTYPIGLDVEACTFQGLKEAWNKGKAAHHREHAMPYLYEGVKLMSVSRKLETGISVRGYRIALLNTITDFGEYRWTVDTAEDLEFIRQVYSRFNGRDDFSWKEVLDLVHNEPGLREINAGVKHKTFNDVDQRGLKG